MFGRGLCAAILAAGLPFAVWPSQAIAQDTSSMETAMRGRVCPADRAKYVELTFKGYGCKTTCADPTRNGEADCGGGVVVGYEFQCQKEVKQKNEIIRAYNSFVESCNRSRPASNANRSPSPPAKPSASSTAPKPEPAPKASDNRPSNQSSVQPSQPSKQNPSSGHSDQKPPTQPPSDSKGNITRPSASTSSGHSDQKPPTQPPSDSKGNITRPSASTPASQLNSALSRAKEVARTKAEGADKKNTEAFENAKQLERPHTLERERQNREARATAEAEQRRNSCGTRSSKASRKSSPLRGLDCRRSCSFCSGALPERHVVLEVACEPSVVGSLWLLLA